MYNSVKLAVTLLTGRALTWWLSVYAELWVSLGQCDWMMFKARLTMALQDANYLLRIRQRLATLQLHTSVQGYNAEFCGLLLEFTATISEQDVLFSYLTGLKTNVQQQVILHSHTTVDRAMELAEYANVFFQFASRQPQPRPKQGQVRGQHGTSGGSQPIGNPGRNGGRGPVLMNLGVAQQPKIQWHKWQPFCYQPPQLQTFTCYNCGQPGHLRQNCPRLTETSVGIVDPGTLELANFDVQPPAPLASFPPPPPSKNWS